MLQEISTVAIRLQSFYNGSEIAMLGGSVCLLLSKLVRNSFVKSAIPDDGLNQYEFVSEAPSTTAKNLNQGSPSVPREAKKALLLANKLYRRLLTSTDLETNV